MGAGTRCIAARSRALVTVLATLALLLLPAQAMAAPGHPAAPGHTAQPGQASQAGQPGGPRPPEPPPPPVWTGAPGTNLAHDSYGYPWPAAPDCDESNVGTGGCVNDGLGFFQGQCTSWVAYRLGQRNGLTFSNWYEGVHWGDAVDWAKVAKRLKHRVDKVPAIGAVGWYARGHVSYVEDVNDDGSIVISEMNIDGHNGFVVHTVYPGDSSWPDRFIHLADVVPVDYTPPERPGPLAGTTVQRGVELRWRVPADDIGVTGYQVFRNGVPLAETTTPAYLDRQASPEQTYSYSVVARDAAGNVSEPAPVVVSQGQRAPDALRGPLLAEDATVLAAGDSTAVCGLVGTRRDPRVGCRLRTLHGWQAVRSGREIAWGAAGTRAFLSGEDGRIWFCRELDGGRSGCVPFDLVTLSWGFDRVSGQPQHAVDASWLVSRSGPTRCGIAADRAACSVLTDAGWRGVHRDSESRPGDPLSRAFVLGRDGDVTFCRVVEGHATCTTLGPRSLTWGHDVVAGSGLAHGRWFSAKAGGPTLCLPEAGCRVVSRR